VAKRKYAPTKKVTQVNRFEIGDEVKALGNFDMSQRGRMSRGQHEQIERWMVLFYQTDRLLFISDIRITSLRLGGQTFKPGMLVRVLPKDDHGHMVGRRNLPELWFRRLMCTTEAVSPPAQMTSLEPTLAVDDLDLGECTCSTQQILLGGCVCGFADRRKQHIKFGLFGD